MDKTFIKGLTLLETLARAERVCGVTELAAAMDLTKSNVHRLLQGLVHQGFARKVANTGRYELTMKLWELGSHVMVKLDVRQIAQPFMEDLAASTTETVHLSVLQGADVLYIAKIDSPQPVRAYSVVGGRAPAQCVATGKAQLAWADPSTLLLVKGLLKKHTSKSITRARDLDDELARIRAQGFATNHGEWREQVFGIAAPVRDASGMVVAAIGISGPADRIKPRRMKALGPSIKQTADEISRRLGFSGNASPVLRRLPTSAAPIDRPRRVTAL